MVEHISPAPTVSYAAPAPSSALRRCVTLHPRLLRQESICTGWHSKCTPSGLRPAVRARAVWSTSPIRRTTDCVPALQSTMTVTGMNMIWTAFQMSYNSPMLGYGTPEQFITSFQVLAWMIINSNRKILNQSENYHKCAH